MARKTTPQVPGATPTTTGNDQSGATTEQKGESQANAGTDGGQSSDLIAVPLSEFEALMARMEQLEQKVKSPAARVATPEAELPSAEDFAGVELKSPVLTKDGWLVPEKMGASPTNRGL